MKERGVIQPSRSAWASPILLADKANGKVRFCIDFRRLNKVTKQDSYPLPDMAKVLTLLNGSSYFLTIDLTDAFWSILVKDSDIEKTAFTSAYGLWEFISMPFGLTNAPATQQRFIEAVLNGLIWQCCFAYIDDILCYSPTFENHLQDLKEIFIRFVVGEVMKERRRRERERLINLSTCGCVIQLYLWENTQFIEIREFG